VTISLILCITAQYCRANSFALNTHAGNRLLSPAPSPVQVSPGLLLASLGCGDAHANNTGRPFRNCVKRTNPVCNSCVKQFSTCS